MSSFNSLLMTESHLKVVKAFNPSVRTSNTSFSLLQLQEIKDFKPFSLGVSFPSSLMLSLLTEVCKQEKPIQYKCIIRTEARYYVVVGSEF